MRKLASIKLVDGIAPIEGRDRICLAFFGGWQIIVKKDEFKVGDKAVFIEIDSVLPEKPEFEFLRSKKFRIRTYKLGSSVSQGICFPLSILPPGNYEVDQDVTELLGIKQYEATMDVDPVTKIVKERSKLFKYFMRFKWFRMTFGKNKKEKFGFPDFISKTDETRIQNIPHILSNKQDKYVVTEKVDGSSMSVFLKRTGKRKFDFGVCSRNVRLSELSGGNYWSAVRKYKIEEALRAIIGDNDFVAIQGEIIAPTIQGNKYKVKEVDFYAFNLLYPSGRVNSVEGKQILEAYGIKWVPIIATDYVLPDIVNELLDYATGESMLYPTLREGLVLRNAEKNISFKAVSPAFLLKYDE